MEAEKAANSKHDNTLGSHIIFNHYFNIAGAPGKYPLLDSMRAAAILLVLMRHAVHFTEHKPDGELWNIWFNGWIGVDLFFTLSGFLITHHLLSNWPRQGVKTYLSHYFLKRSLRILPLYIVILTITTMALVPFFRLEFEVSYFDILIHTVFMQDYFHIATILVPLWSLGVEEKFYLLAPLLAYLAYNYVQRDVVIGCCIVLLLTLLIRGWMLHSDADTLSYNDFFWQYRAPFHFSVAGILCGAISALVYKKCQASLVAFQLRGIVSLALLVMVLLILSWQPWMEENQWHYANIVIVLISICFSTLLLLCLATTQLNDTLIQKVLRFIAKIAYPLYLCHLLIIPLATVITHAILLPEDPLYFYAFFLIYLGLSITFASALHLLIEKPFLLIKDRL